MKNGFQTIVIGGANLIALGLATGDATVLKAHFSDSKTTNKVQAMSDVQMRSIEASHLEVYAGCKWGHAAFDPVRVDAEVLSPGIRSIYDQMTPA